MYLCHVFAYTAFPSVHCEPPADRRSGYTNIRIISKKFATFFGASVLVHHVCLFKETCISCEVILHDEVGDFRILIVDDEFQGVLRIGACDVAFQDVLMSSILYAGVIWFL